MNSSQAARIASAHADVRLASGLHLDSAGCAPSVWSSGPATALPPITGEYGGAAFVLMLPRDIVISCHLMVMEFAVVNASQKELGSGVRHAAAVCQSGGSSRGGATSAA